MEQYGVENYSSSIGIFHTRWATHGVIEKRNAHPLTDCSGKIAIVHNGIVENYHSLKERLKDHSFSSLTDSEVIAHLIEEGMKNGQSFQESVRATVTELKGSSSFVAIHFGTEEMIAVKNGSPLILAIADRGFFISSDIPSVLNFTDRVVYLHDGDIIRLSPRKYDIENVITSEPVHEVSVVKFRPYATEKGNFLHYMEKEIHEQPGLWNSSGYFSSQPIMEAAEMIRNAGRIYLVGAGSSHFAALHGARTMRKNGKDALAVLPQDVENYSGVMKQNDVFIFVSQSGETADVIQQLDRINGHKKVGIINVDHSYLTEKMDVVIPMNVGVENAVAATKSLTGSMIILTILANVCCGKEEQARKEYNLLTLNDFNLEVPAVEQAIDEVADLIRNEEHLYIAGKGEAFLLAREGALKMKEVTYIHTEALDLSSLKHGPIALMENGVKVITIVMDGDTESDYNIEELRARGATVIGISPSASTKYDRFIRTVPAGVFSFAPVLYVLQFLAYRTAVKSGLNPDRPRNLAKSVTVK